MGATEWSMSLLVSSLLHPKKNTRRLFFHDQIILYGFDPFDAPYDFTRFIDGLLRINESAQLNGAFERFDTDLKRFEKIIFREQGFYLGRYDRIVNVFTCTFLCGCQNTGRGGGNQHKNH
jgi:hypothetical protein